MTTTDLRQKAWSAALIVLFFVAWELFCVMTGMSDLVLPRPSQVFVTLFQKPALKIGMLVEVAGFGKPLFSNPVFGKLV